MGPKWGTVLLAFLYLVCLTGSSTAFQCNPANWNDTVGPNPFTERRGKVVLVAMHKGYCGYCVQQAGRLYELKNELISGGFPDIDMIIINGGEPRSRNNVNRLINASPLQVIQDTPEHVLYRQVFMASKDDFLVYDRCGQAAIYIPHPWSDLDRSATRHVLKAVHMGRHNCYCSLDYPPRNLDDTMQGDDPGVRFYQAHDMSRNMLQCNPTDNNCLIFQRAINEFSRRDRMGRQGNFRRGAFRRRLNTLRHRFESSDSDTERPGSRAVGGRRVNGLGGRGFGGGRRRNIGGRRPQGVQERGRPRQNRIAGGV